MKYFMTVVISYVSDEFSLIVTDTRITFIDASFNDNIGKLRSLAHPLGWCAGLGYSPYLEKFKDLTTKNYMRDLTEIENLVKMSKDFIIETDPDSFSEVIKSTLLLSYTLEENENKYPQIG